METQQGVVETLVKNAEENRKLRRLFRYNAQMKHGVPDDSEPQQPITVNHQVTNTNTGADHQTATVRQPDNPAPPPPSKKKTGDGGLFDKKNLLTAAAIALGAAGVGLGGGYIANTFIGSSGDDSLLQELEDNGQHIP